MTSKTLRPPSTRRTAAPPTTGVSVKLEKTKKDIVLCTALCWFWKERPCTALWTYLLYFVSKSCLLYAETVQLTWMIFTGFERFECWRLKVSKGGRLIQPKQIYPSLCSHLGLTLPILLIFGCVQMRVLTVRDQLNSIYLSSTCLLLVLQWTFCKLSANYNTSMTSAVEFASGVHSMQPSVPATSWGVDFPGAPAPWRLGTTIFSVLFGVKEPGPRGKVRPSPARFIRRLDKLRFHLISWHWRDPLRNDFDSLVSRNEFHKTMVMRCYAFQKVRPAMNGVRAMSWTAVRPLPQLEGSGTPAEGHSSWHAIHWKKGARPLRSDHNIISQLIFWVMMWWWFKLL